MLLIEAFYRAFSGFPNCQGERSASITYPTGTKIRSYLFPIAINEIITSHFLHENACVDKLI